jgi:hypothetical protein
MPEKVVAKVDKIPLIGKHGPYFVCRTRAPDGSELPQGEEIQVTVSLSKKPGYHHWFEETWPEKGDMILLEDLRLRPLGWRAHHAKFVRLGDLIANRTDQQQEKRKEYRVWNAKVEE